MSEYNLLQKKKKIKSWKGNIQNFQMGLIILVRHRDNNGENLNWTNLTVTVLLIRLEMGLFLDQHLIQEEEIKKSKIQAHSIWPMRPKHHLVGGNEK